MQQQQFTPFYAIIYIANTNHGALLVDGSDNVVAESLENCSHYTEDIFGVNANSRLAGLAPGLYYIEGKMYDRGGEDGPTYTISGSRGIKLLWEKKNE